MNMLGKRNPTFCGTDTLKSLQKKVFDYAKTKGAKVVFAQSNCEGKLVDILQKTKCDAVIFNAGAYSHYSYALRDCIECISLPVVEVHLSNIYARETFRHTDVLKDVCTNCFYGNGIKSYFDAVDFLTDKNSATKK